MLHSNFFAWISPWTKPLVKPHCVWWLGAFNVKLLKTSENSSLRCQEEQQVENSVSHCRCPRTPALSQLHFSPAKSLALGYRVNGKAKELLKAAGRGGDLRKPLIKGKFCFKDYFEFWQMLKFVDDSVSLRMATHQDTAHQIPRQSPPARQAKHR